MIEAQEEGNVAKSDIRMLIDPSPTRQIQRLSAIIRFRELYRWIINALGKCAGWTDSDAAENAIKLLRKILSKDFALSLVFIDHFMRQLIIPAQTFQSVNCDISLAKKQLQNVVDHIQTVNLEHLSQAMVHEANELTKGINLVSGYMLNRNYSTPDQYCRIRIIEPVFANFLATTSAKFSHTEYDIVDLAQNVKEKLVSANIGELLPIMVRYKGVINKRSENGFYKAEILQELKALESFSVSFDQPLVEIAKAILPLKNLSKLLTICATVWVSTSSAERAFSKLRLIKSHLRANMKQERLSGIAVISSNKDVVVDPEAIIDEFLNKERKVDF